MCRRRPDGYAKVMTDVFQPPANATDMVNDQASDVLNEDEIVHVPPAVEQLVESQELHSTYPPDVPDWDGQSEPPGTAPPPGADPAT
jgi:hypothetical protein